MNSVSKTNDEWRKELSPEEYHVIREKGTEPAFTGAYWDNHERGMYVCRACGEELFSSDTKFDSGTGWPSFTDPVHREHVELVPDESHGMHRVEVVCKRCGAHLGHVFDDGPNTLHNKSASGKRYCINSISLQFKEEEKKK